MDPTAEQALLDKVGRNGWTVIGRTPETESVSGRDENNQPITTQRATGNLVWTITDGKGHNQVMTVSAGIPNQNAGDVVKPPSDLPAGSKPATPAAGLERLDENLQPTTDPAKTVYVRDPNAPAGTPPFKVDPTVKTDPSTWTPITDPNDKSDNPRVIGLWDPANNKIGANVTAPAGTKPSDPSKWTPVYRTPGDSSSGVVGQWDPTNSELHAVSAAPDGTQIVTTPNAIYVVNKDTGKSEKVQDIAPGDVNKQAVTVGGKVYTFDPKDGSFTLPTNVTAAATVGNSTTLKELVWYDDQGNEVARRPNPNYQAPAAQVPSPNTVAPYIQTPDPNDPSKLIWIENKGQVTASQALKDLASHLTGQVVDGKISVDEAKTLIDASNQRMTTEATQAQTTRAAAGDILTATQQRAQTGAGLINQRVQAASGMLQNILGQATGAKNLMTAPAGLGEALTQGIAGYTADLAGGQQTLDSAARMVQMADPSSNMADPATQHAIGVLTQMLDKYQDVSGAPHPAVAATQAAAQSQQAGGMTAPYTQMSPLGGGVANSIPGGVASQPYETAAQSQARNAMAAVNAVPAVNAVSAVNAVPAVGQAVGAGFMAPQIGAAVGSGFTAPHSPVTITVG